eukprot:CAMPEP_0114260684 /NCGR_PEP_ID=MMETSP0058-20121206/20637_1 /TAXON_ID=36894 /ORGANISM="Pyramimonas parkeae, CCMP726" /LENGTH=88 /DNA_ID=CAMNT_0001375973 /DNA_START=562 /DNA_END=828 /DNA_ORIENTATION=+
MTSVVERSQSANGALGPSTLRCKSQCLRARAWSVRVARAMDLVLQRGGQKHGVDLAWLPRVRQPLVVVNHGQVPRLVNEHVLRVAIAL